MAEQSQDFVPEKSDSSLEKTGLSIVYRPGGGRQEGVKIDVVAYDFRNPICFTENEMRQLQAQHEKFVHYLAARLAMFFRMDFGLKMGKLQTISYSKYMESITNPSHVSLFNVDGLTGVGILDVHPRLAMTLVSRMLGGKGQAITEERQLTEIEISLMDEVVDMMLTEWCRQWTAVKTLSANVIGHENSSRFLQVAPSDAMMIVLVMEATMGDCTQNIQLGVPYGMMEPIIKEIQAQQKKISTMGAIEKKVQWQNTYSGVKIPLFAQWDLSCVLAKDILALRVGDVICVPEDVAHRSVLKLRNIPQFIGEIGLENNKVAFKIKEKIQKEN